MANQFRNFCLTINNPEETDEQFFEYCKSLPHIKYFIFSREKGEETGTQHFQIYIEFTLGKRFDYMKKAFPRAHIEERKGSKTQAREYCLKSDTHISGPYEFGTFAEERERSDWTDILGMIEDGATNKEIREAYPSQFLRYYKAIEDNREMLLCEKYSKVRRVNLKVTYIYGNAGVGKTSYVLDKFGDDNVFCMTDYGSSHNIERFDGYCGQDVLLFDDYHSEIELTRMLRYLDIYPLQLPARFHNKTACYTQVFIISNLPFTAQYSDIKRSDFATWEGFYRRIDEVYDFNISKKKVIATPKSEYAQRQKRFGDKELFALSDEQIGMLPF